MANRRFSLINHSHAGSGSSGVILELSDLTDINTSTPTARNVLVADGVDWESRALVEADISDFGSYASSGHTHVEADITDLQAYLTAEVNDLSAAVTWANVPDANITASSVTQHEAALTILESQITDGTLLARVADNEIISGDWTFNGTTTINGPITFNDLLTAAGGLVAVGATVQGDLEITGETTFLDDLIIADGKAINWDTVEVLKFTATAPAGDSLWANTQVLFLAEGSNLDVSGTTEDVTGYAWSVSGNPTLVTAQKPFADSTTSLYGPGVAGDIGIISVGGDAATRVGAQDFCIEEMVRFESNPVTNGDTIVSKYGTAGSREWIVRLETSGKLGFVYSVNGVAALLITSTVAWNPSIDTWYHVAVTREGANLRFFVDGTQLGTTDTTLGTTTINQNAADIHFFSYSGLIATAFGNGWISDFRFTVGDARYTANFTAPTAQLPVGAGGAGGASFIVGDPAYSTQIDGLTLNITSASTDIDGTLNVDGAATLQSTLNVGGAVDFGSTLAITGALTALSYGGITEANLLDKTATETISGSYTFTSNLALSKSTPSINITETATGKTGQILKVDTTEAFLLRPTSGVFDDDFIWLPATGWQFDKDCSILGSLYVKDAGATDYAEFSHDGTDFNTVFTNTTDWNITGATGWLRLNNFTGIIDNSGGMDLYLTGGVLRLRNTAGTVYTQLVQGTVNSTLTFSGVSIMDLQLDGNTQGITITDAGASKIWIDKASTTLDIRDGWNLVIRDAGDTDYATFSHDGADFNTAFTNTADWNITGLTGNIVIDPAIDILLDATATTRAFIRTKTVAGSIQAILRRGATTDVLNLGAAAFSLTLAGSSVNITEGLTVGKSIKIAELAAAEADVAGSGQLWVKNTTPCQLWFTDDAGNDTQIV